MMAAPAAKMSLEIMSKYCSCLGLISTINELLVIMLILRVRPIPVSGIGRYSPILVNIGIGRYLFEYRRRYQSSCRSFTCLNSQHCCNAQLHTYSFKPIPYFHAYTPHTYDQYTRILRTKSHFQYKKICFSTVSVSVSVQLWPIASSIGYRTPARYRSNPTRTAF